MRSAIALVLLVASISQGAVADVKRYKTMPQLLWGRWGPSQDACQNSDASVFLVSDTIISISGANCRLDSISETPSEQGPKYSALLRCPKSGAESLVSQTVLILWPKGSGRLSAGSTFDALKDYQLCPNPH